MTNAELDRIIARWRLWGRLYAAGWVAAVVVMLGVLVLWDA